jgi:hypothetical protein
VKPGYKTTEFWVSVVAAGAALAAAVQGALPPKYAAIAGAVAVFGYAVARGLAKQGTPGA